MPSAFKICPSLFDSFLIKSSFHLNNPVYNIGYESDGNSSGDEHFSGYRPIFSIFSKSKNVIKIEKMSFRKPDYRIAYLLPNESCVLSLIQIGH